MDRLAVPNSLSRVALVDALVLVSFYVTIVFAHILPFPLYQFDPMKILVLITVVYSNRGNSMGIAAALPVLSFLSTGHPVFPKFLIMSGELMVFAFVLGMLSQSRSSGLVAFLGAVLISKLAYYFIKFSVISLGWLQTPLLTTSVITQLQALLILLCVFGLVDFFLRKTD